jgi:hypothetical protein
MRNNRLPVVVIVAAALAVAGLLVALRRGMQPAEPAQKPVAGGEHVRSVRVEERLQLLREVYARGEHARAQAEAPPAAEAAPPGSKNAAAAPPANTTTGTDTQQPEIDRGRRDAWAVGKPTPAAGAPRPAKRGFKRDPHTILIHYGTAFGQHWDAAKIRDTILDGKDPAARRTALDFLAGEDDAEAISILTTALLANDPDPSFRAALVAAFGDYTEQISANLLDGALRDEAPEVRFEALSVLADMDTPDARKAIQAAANDPDPDVRDLAQGIVQMQ